ncbi:MAG: CHASE2 domain-containing protein [Xanthobacteraceae bacterium]
MFHELRKRGTSGLVTRRAPAIAGIATFAVILAAILGAPSEWRELLRDNAFDVVLAADRHLHRTKGETTRIVVIDIDRRSIEAVGAWPWPRETVAKLVDAVAAAQPAALALDILFHEADTRSPAALARRLGHQIARPDIVALADDLADGDKRLADALAPAPAVLGFLLDPDQSQSLPGAPIVTTGPLPIRQLWRAAGALAPPPSLLAAADGIGTMSLPGEADGTVRRVPLLVGVADAILPGLALEAVRLARRASAYVVQPESRTLAAGDLSIALPSDALLRLLPGRPRVHSARTISAVDMLQGKVPSSRVAGAIAVIGGSAPELGGLRQTVTDPLTPSVQIQADAIAQILARRVPRSFDSATVVEWSLSCLFAILAVAAGAALSPVVGVMLTVFAVWLVWAAALVLLVVADRLLDPLTPSFFAAFAFVVTSGVSYSQTRRREALVRRRFEQHLAPAVVSRIVQNPSLVKLGGERREVTSLFTDVEGFTTMTQYADPERLVAVLDSYFEGLATIVIEHGGMVDKIVGDGVHALFNVPVDLDEHARRAVACAVAIRKWSTAYRAGAEPAALRFGRTRVGVETGSAVVGDVGIKAKLDYTAHGDAVNVTARLEAANKELGSTICVGPTAAERCDPALLRPLGTITVRGREGALAVFEPWPEDVSASWRERYLAACGLIDVDCERAVALYVELAAERPHDPVARRMAERLCAGD